MLRSRDAGIFGRGRGGWVRGGSLGRTDAGDASQDAGNSDDLLDDHQAGDESWTQEAWTDGA